jgi:hypothetical protein
MCCLVQYRNNEPCTYLFYTLGMKESCGLSLAMHVDHEVCSSVYEWLAHKEIYIVGSGCATLAELSSSI